MNQSCRLETGSLFSLVFNHFFLGGLPTLITWSSFGSNSLFQLRTFEHVFNFNALLQFFTDEILHAVMPLSKALSRLLLPQSPFSGKYLVDPEFGLGVIKSKKEAPVFGGRKLKSTAQSSKGSRTSKLKQKMLYRNKTGIYIKKYK